MSALYGKIRQVGAWHTGPPTTIRRRPIGCFHRRPTEQRPVEKPVAEKMPITHTQRCETNTHQTSQRTSAQIAHNQLINLIYDFNSILRQLNHESALSPTSCHGNAQTFFRIKKNELKSKIIKKKLRKKGKANKKSPGDGAAPPRSSFGGAGNRLVGGGGRLSSRSPSRVLGFFDFPPAASRDSRGFLLRVNDDSRTDGRFRSVCVCRCRNIAHQIKNFYFKKISGSFTWLSRII